MRGAARPVIAPGGVQHWNRGVRAQTLGRAVQVLVEHEVADHERGEGTEAHDAVEQGGHG